ncbi:hypothetical protein THAOC_37166, partial [Thalassiosira oceanica]
MDIWDRMDFGFCWDRPYWGLPGPDMPVGTTFLSAFCRDQYSHYAESQAPPYALGCFHRCVLSMLVLAPVAISKNNDSIPPNQTSRRARRERRYRDKTEERTAGQRRQKTTPGADDDRPRSPERRRAKQAYADRPPQHVTRRAAARRSTKAARGEVPGPGSAGRGAAVPHRPRTPPAPQEDARPGAARGAAGGVGDMP